MTIDIASGKYRLFTRGNNTLNSADGSVGPLLARAPHLYQR
ncbi:MAG: hypothetical protein RLZZ582_1128 [Verrucomicrobiota bacterium]|jgi:hypothetical protein|nr:hypothetical protein [Verrucomicrobiota bacterium]